MLGLVRGLLKDPRALDPEARDLRRRLDDFYASSKEYGAFVEPTDNSAYYAKLRPYIDRAIARHGRARVLELGAGRSRFGTFRRASGASSRASAGGGAASDARAGGVEYTAQDVTPQNRAHLEAEADRVHIGDVSGLEGPFDVVFSTYVFEHVTNPSEFLSEVSRLLAPGGAHVLFCPNYELPGYLCPSLRHLGRVERAAAMLFFAGSRVRARLDGAPRFWVNADPALFHVRWYRDADAVHVVSRHDVVAWHRARGFTVERLRPRPPEPPRAPRELRRYAIEREITLMLACVKPDAAPR